MDVFFIGFWVGRMGRGFWCVDAGLGGGMDGWFWMGGGGRESGGFYLEMEMEMEIVAGILGGGAGLFGLRCYNSKGLW